MINLLCENHYSFNSHKLAELADQFGIICWFWLCNSRKCAEFVDLFDLCISILRYILKAHAQKLGIQLSLHIDWIYCMYFKIHIDNVDTK